MSAFYILAGIALLIVLQIDADRLKISGGAIPAWLLPHVTISLVLHWLLCVLNAALLVRFLSFSRRKAR